MKILLSFILAMLGLSACATTPTGPITGSPVALNHGNLPNDMSSNYDSGADTVTLTIGGAVRPAMHFVPVTANGYSFYQEGVTDNFAIRGASASGSFLIFSSPTANLGLAGTQIVRTGGTQLPTTGSATFSGAYAGFLVDSSLEYQRLITADAALTADFAAATVHGGVSNRVIDVDSMADLTLQSTAITSTAGFSGSTMGGRHIGVGSMVSDGTYSGVFVGTGGQEIVGGVSVDHRIGGMDFIEIGGFIAN